MPISECDGCGPAHWAEVKSVIEMAVRRADMRPRLVSDSFESNLIHREILHNIYNDLVIVVDVSGRNPNVFFELGIRMATQKPIVVIKDDVTLYPFDTAPNRYVEYPRDLRHGRVLRFIDELALAIQRAEEHDESKSFIGQLGPFKVPDVASQAIPLNEIVLERLDRIEARLPSTSESRARTLDSYISGDIGFWLDNQGRTSIRSSSHTIKSIADAVKSVATKKFPSVSVVSFREEGQKSVVIVQGVRISRLKEFGDALINEIDYEIPF